MQAITKGLAMKALWQIEFLQKFNQKIVLFIDEPYLGCFGSAYTPINREDVIGVLSGLAKELSVKRDKILLGLHCCGNTDWSIFTDIDEIDIISFDAFSYLDRLMLYSQQLHKFLQAGRVLCWGIVPTQEFSGKENPQSLAERIKVGIDTLVKKGIPRDLLYQSLFLSPACGLGTLDISKSEAIFKLLCKISIYLRNKNI
jgi:methionine synthase II (cobalamin-independent)